MVLSGVTFNRPAEMREFSCLMESPSHWAASALVRTSRGGSIFFQGAGIRVQRSGCGFGVQGAGSNRVAKLTFKHGLPNGYGSNFAPEFPEGALFHYYRW